MRVTIPKSNLLAALSTVRKALSSHNVNPIFDGIYVSATGSTLKLLCSDSSLQIEREVEATVHEEGAIVLPGHLFAEISAKLPDEGDIEIKRIGEQIGVSIQCGSFNMSLTGMPAEDFPQISSETAPFTLRIEAATLKDMIARTWFSAAVDQSRPVLTGLLFEVEEEATDKLSIVALSNNRMAIAREGCQASGPLKAILPAVTLNKIAGILGDEDEQTIAIQFGRSHAYFDLNDTKIHCLLLAGEFMRYKSLIPESFKANVYLSRRDLNDAITRASLMARDNEKKFVRLLIESDVIQISSTSEMGYVRESLPIRCQGTELEIAFNVKYISDILARLNDEEIAIRLQSSNAAAVFEPIEGNRYFYLVAPVQI